MRRRRYLLLAGAVPLTTGCLGKLIDEGSDLTVMNRVEEEQKITVEITNLDQNEVVVNRTFELPPKGTREPGDEYNNTFHDIWKRWTTYDISISTAAGLAESREYEGRRTVLASIHEDRITIRPVEK